MSMAGINTWLKTNYGSVDDGRSRFRVVWANSQLEKRQGTRRVFFGPVFLHEEMGVFEEQKYVGPMFKDFWVLETLILNHNNPELVNADNGSYEPIFVFRDKEYSPLPVTKKFLIFFLHHYFLEAKTTPWSARQEEDDKEAREIEEFKSVLEEDGGSFLHKQLKYGEAISMGGLVIPK